jgi:hypothetical protein
MFSELQSLKRSNFSPSQGADEAKMAIALFSPGQVPQRSLLCGVAKIA